MPISMVEEIIGELKANTEKALESFKRDLTKIRTGRANLAILDGIRVDYYGTATPLNQVASLQVADPRLIVIKPWEKTMCQPIANTIRQTDLGLNPSTDGEVVRVPIPPLTEERRKEFVKLIKRMGEEAKVAVRNHRRDANELLKEVLDEKKCSEDDFARAEKRVQEATDQSVAKIDDVINRKEKEILEV